MSLRCLVVDDDAVARSVLERFISRREGLELIGSIDNPIDAANFITREEIDVLFLDVMMPEMTGLDLVRSLSSPPSVVLVSAHPDFAAEAFDTEVVDFIVKPVTWPRFLRAVERASRAGTESEKPNALFVKADGRLVKVDLSGIQWCEAQGDYVMIHTSERSLLAATSMRKIEEELPRRDFFRVHRSYIVRLDQIDDIEETTLVIGRQVIPISTSNRRALQRRLRRV